MSRVYRCTIRAKHLDGTLVEPSVHYQTDLQPLGDEPDPSDVAAGLWGHWGSACLQCLPDSVKVDELVVVEQVLPPAIGVVGSFPVGLVGSHQIFTNEDLPHGLVPILNVRSDTSSRNARGHFSLACPGSKNDLSQGKWSGGMVTAYNAFAALLDDDLSLGSVLPSTLRPVVFSRTRMQREQDPFTFKVIAVTPNATPHWLRSRMTNP